METIKWDASAALAKASKGSFAEKAVRIDVYKNNNEIFKCGSYETARGTVVNIREMNEKCLAGTKVYSRPIELGTVETIEDGTAFDVRNIGCLEMAKKLVDAGLNPAVLNLADAYTACGWYYKGSNAQEESLCRMSTLSQSLYQYYQPKWAETVSTEFKGEGYPMDINYGGIYSPEVIVFREGVDDGYALLDEPWKVGIISLAALDFNEKHGKNREYQARGGGFTEEGEEIMRNKIRTILRIALENGHDGIVLGAFGCGAFRLHPERVAQLFDETFEEEEFKDKFKYIVFAILEAPNGPQGRSGKFAPFYRKFA